MHTSGEFQGMSSGSIHEKPLKSRYSATPEIPHAPRVDIQHAVETEHAVDQLTKQMLVSAAYFCTIFIIGICPATAQFASRFYYVQHAHQLNGKLVSEAGHDDWGVVISSGMAVIGLRALAVRIFLRVAPFYNITKPKSAVRFAEQSWCVVYYSLLTSIGIYLLYDSDYSWKPKQLWHDYPHINMDAGVKAYYLFQLGFWVTQIYIIHAEERRKDHYQMLTHHFITCLLVIGSYVNFYTRIGHLIMIIMDGVDFQLCFAKCLKYAGFSKACDVAFMLFLVGWVSLRHVFFVWQLLYAYLEAPKAISDNCKWSIAESTYVCFNQSAHSVFGFLLLCLQVLTLIWLWMIVKVVIKVMRGQGAEDTRSDDEDED